MSDLADEIGAFVARAVLAFRRETERAMKVTPAAWPEPTPGPVQTALPYPGCYAILPDGTRWTLDAIDWGAPGDPMDAVVMTCIVREVVDVDRFHGLDEQTCGRTPLWSWLASTRQHHHPNGTPGIWRIFYDNGAVIDHAKAAIKAERATARPSAAPDPRPIP